MCSLHFIVHDKSQRECQPCQYIDGCTHYSQLQRESEGGGGEREGGRKEGREGGREGGREEGRKRQHHI